MFSYPVRVQFAKHAYAEEAISNSTEKGVEIIKPSATKPVVWLIVSGKSDLDSFEKAGRFTVLHKGKIAQMELITNPAVLKRN